MQQFMTNKINNSFPKLINIIDTISFTRMINLYKAVNMIGVIFVH